MTYNLFTVAPLQQQKIYDGLASCFEVSSHAVDVAASDGDQENRNWEALVLCDCSNVRGDVAVALDIYIQDSVDLRPPEAKLALDFARVTRSVVLYPAEERIPSAYWLVTPDGLVTRARLLVSDDDVPTYSIDAVEAAVPSLSEIRVMQLPEIVRAQHVPTPVAADFDTALEDLRQTYQGSIEPDLVDEPGTALYHSRIHLVEWEQLVRRMEVKWQPSGRYPVDMYRDSLRARDQLAHLEMGLPQTVSTLLRQSVAQLDGHFKRYTERDDGFAVSLGAVASLAEIGEYGWWWRRRPENVPWGES
ncbi:hypothetical protein [Streptomyces sp. NPDC005322]|uniref:hypothetical protein n=1 Tax=Streptomyces sp. NPDC005322 TaxID=3157032 RepID=UPI0033A47536